MDVTEYVRFAAALLFVLGLICAGALILRSTGWNPGGMAIRRDARRLAIKEVLSLDPRRRLAIISCDDIEHLIILGPQGETVIDARIPPPATKEAITGAAPSSPSILSALKWDRAS